MKKSCHALGGLVETYLDGELEPSQLLEVESHTDTCTTCAERVLVDRAVRGAVRRSVTEAKPSPELRGRLVAAVLAEKAFHKDASLGVSRLVHMHSVRGWMLVAAAAAAAALPLLWKAHTSATGPDAFVGISRPHQGREGLSTASMGIDSMIDEMVDWHANPLPPEVTDARDLPSFEPYVGVPVRAPRLMPFGARWLGGRILPVVDHRVTAMLQYTMQDGHRVTVYVYDPRKIRVQPSMLRPQVVGNDPVYVGQVRGYSFAAAERRGVGYAIASDLDNERSAELAAAAVP